MIKLAVTQRVSEFYETGETRDGLDQRWAAFLGACAILPVPMPNAEDVARALLREVRPDGILLTGGGNLSAYGGRHPERDRTEDRLIQYALAENIPLMGVCRGMQAIQNSFGVALHPVAGHVAEKAEISINGARAMVNSYHELGATESVDALEVWAVADDGVIKAVRHTSRPVIGVMWHPERLAPFRREDISLYSELFR